MAAKRYELNEAQWAKIWPLLPGKAGDPGRTATDNQPVTTCVYRKPLKPDVVVMKSAEDRA